MMFKFFKSIAKYESLIPFFVISIFIIYYFYHLGANLDATNWDVDGGSDSIFAAITIKSLIENGWAAVNPRMGAPFGSNLLDFPGSDGAFIILIKLISIFSSGPATVLNLFYTAGFLTTFYASYWVLRQFSFSVVWSSVAALIFTCAPYHFLRGVSHLYLSNYYAVPLWVYLAIVVREKFDTSININHLKSWSGLILILIFASSGGVYYAFFGVLFVLLAALLTATELNSFRPITYAVKISIITLFVQVLNIFPNILYWLQYGVNTGVAKRQAIESDIYGLRISQLLLPIWGHQNKLFADFSRNYHDSLRPITEATSSALGLIAGLGFLLLILIVLAGQVFVKDKKLILLSRLNFASILYGTTGGFSVLFAMLITSQFRGVSRISIFISFISLLSLFIWLRECAFIQRINVLKTRYASVLLALIVVLISLYDQIPAGARQGVSVSERNKTYQKFIEKIESEISHGGMIYTLPYIQFPEAAAVNKEGYNAMMRTYFYSQHAHWSYGAMKGRVGDAWLSELEKFQIQKRLQALRNTGFEGVYIDRLAFADHGQLVESDLKKYADGPVITSDDGNYAFYPLRPTLINEIAPITAHYPYKNFYPTEKDGFVNWNWSSGNGVYAIYNFSEKIQNASFKGKLLALDRRYIKVLHNNNVLARLQINNEKNTDFHIAILLQPGLNIVAITSEEASIRIPSDPRSLAYRLISPVVELN